MSFSLVMHTYGAMYEYRRAIFSLWSFYLHLDPKDRNNIPGLVFTDDPGVFEVFCAGLPLQYVLLTKDRIREMRGEIDFVHRVKICVIEEAFKLTNDNILYVDSDTFFISSPFPYTDRLSPTLAFMHKYEYRLKELRNFLLPSFQELQQFLESRTFRLADREEFKVPMEQVSWNAGVIILHREHQKLLKDVFALTDAFHKGTKHHGSEQYAFSLVLDRNGRVQPCEDMVYHFWLPVKKPIADKFLAARITSEWSGQTPDKKMEQVREWVKEFPDFIADDVLMTRHNALQAFYEGRLFKGYRFAVKAFLQQPSDKIFIMDVLYHTKRLIREKRH